MARPPAKSESRRIQRQHVRKVRTKTGKKPVLVNKGVKKSRQQTLGRSFEPRQERSGSSKGQSLPPPPKVQLRPQVKPTRAEKKEFGRWAEDMAAALQMRMIAHQGWESAYPELIKNLVVPARLIQLKNDPRDFEVYATDEEALGYLSTASLAGPPVHEWADITMYLFNKVMPENKVPDDLKGHAVLDDYRMGMLRDLKRWIRKKQWKDYKSRNKEGQT
jgi:hypothetical protein